MRRPPLSPDSKGIGVRVRRRCTVALEDSADLKIRLAAPVAAIHGE
ncbi:MAG: hypothetical protein JWL97_3672 [Gemmatimonadales bacterium]|jgi:hypothetical protein|nr:hypothetical protein [Gemmatimonadales bacterium]